MAKGRKKGSRSTRKPATRHGHAARLRATLAEIPPRLIAPRADLQRRVAPVAAEADAVAVAADDAGRTFVAAVSIDGPWELRSLVINDFQILDKTVPTSDRRIDVPIPSSLGSPLAITWAILAGHMIPSLGTFVEESGQQAVQLASKGPLNKGESWAPLLPVTFPKE